MSLNPLSVPNSFCLSGHYQYVLMVEPISGNLVSADAHYCLALSFCPNKRDLFTFFIALSERQKISKKEQQVGSSKLLAVTYTCWKVVNIITSKARRDCKTHEHWGWEVHWLWESGMWEMWERPTFLCQYNLFISSFFLTLTLKKLYARCLYNLKKQKQKKLLNSIKIANLPINFHQYLNYFNSISYHLS